MELAQFRALVAFTQFGSDSDLDKASQAQLARGRRMVEILKQGQYQPLPVEKQVAIMFAGSSGALDDLPVDQCRKFEAGLYGFIDNAHPAIWNQIREKKNLDDALKAELQKAIKEFKERFVAEQKTATAKHA